MTFADSLNTGQSDKERGMTDCKALLLQLTERRLCVMTKTCCCSGPISTLLTSSAFRCISLREVPFPCMCAFAESLSSSLHYFPSWSCLQFLRSAPSCRLTKFWECESLALCSVSPLSEIVCRGRKNQSLLHLCCLEQLQLGIGGVGCYKGRFG